MIVFSSYRWYHLCFTYNHISFLIQTFLDGKVVQHALYDVGRPVFGDLIGVGNGQAATESFSGDITQVALEPTQGYIHMIHICLLTYIRTRTDKQINNKYIDNHVCVCKYVCMCVCMYVHFFFRAYV